jgi:ATPase subunit of ABC transporter with duplicated ATPase domains
MFMVTNETHPPVTVDAHTAHHLYHNCLRGDLMKGRTVILVSHHVQLCAPGASYIVALDNGKVAFSGGNSAFQDSAVKSSLILSESSAAKEDEDAKEEVPIEEVLDEKEEGEATPVADASSTSASARSSTIAPTITTDAKMEKKKPRKLVEEEKRAVGRISRDIWETYVWACGQKTYVILGGYPISLVDTDLHRYWTIFLLILIIATMAPVAENFWLKYV